MRKDSSIRSLQKTDEKKPKIGNVSLFIGKKDSFYPCTLDDIKMARKKRNLERVWMRLVKQVHLMKCMQFWIERQPNRSLVDEYREMFSSLTLAGTIEKVAWLGRIKRSHRSLVLRL